MQKKKKTADETYLGHQGHPSSIIIASDHCVEK